VRCGDTTVVASPGSYFVLPAGVKHTFRVTGPHPARMLLIHAATTFSTSSKR
jgi:quercetin dioxygenase-like cupin family protein